MGYNFSKYESLQYNFITLPVALITHPLFRELSSDAKILYSLILNKMYQSQPNGWVDDQDNVYVIYGWQEICEQMGCSRNTVTKIIRELEGAKLIIRKIMGQGKASHIYPQNFVKLIEKQKDNTMRAQSEKGNRDPMLLLSPDQNPEIKAAENQESSEKNLAEISNGEVCGSENPKICASRIPKFVHQESQSLCIKAPKICASRLPKSVHQESQSLCIKNPKVCASRIPKFVHQESQSLCIKNPKVCASEPENLENTGKIGEKDRGKEIAKGEVRGSQNPKICASETETLENINIFGEENKNNYLSVSQSIKNTDGQTEEFDKPTEGTNPKDYKNFRQRIHVDQVANQTGYTEAAVQNFLGLIENFLCGGDESSRICVGKRELAADTVHSLVAQLRDEHMVHVLNKLKTVQPTNPQAYFLMAVLNSVTDVTIGRTKGKSHKGFNNFTGRNYNFQTLEALLLKADERKKTCEKTL